MLLLDTHAWVWWIGGPACPRLPVHARRAVDCAGALGLCSVSLLEVAWLAARGRLAFDRDTRLWVEQAVARPRLSLLDVTPEIALRAASLEWSNRDPADRVIAATARCLGVPLVTGDKLFRRLEGLDVIW